MSHITVIFHYFTLPKDLFLSTSSFLGNTIVLSNCTTVWYKCSDATTMVTWCHNSSTMAAINRKYTWIHFLLLPPSGYSIQDHENSITFMSRKKHLPQTSLPFGNPAKICRNLWGIALHLLTYYLLIFEWKYVKPYWIVIVATNSVIKV